MAEMPKTQVQSTTNRERDELKSIRKPVIFLGAVMVVYILYIVFSGQLDEFVGALAGVDIWWVVRGAACMLCYYLLGVMGYAVPVSRDKDSPLGFRDLMSAEAAGIFFSYLSPGGAGSAPARIYRLTRAGLTVGAASALQCTRYIIYEAAEGIFAAIMLIFRYQYFVSTVGNFAVIGLVLFGAKIIAVTGLILFCVFPRFVRRIGNTGIRLLEKTPLKLDYAGWRDALNNQSQEFSDGFKSSAKDWKMMAFAVLISMSQLTCQYALGWFVAHAFGFHDADLVTCLAAGSMLELLTSAVPLPGGEGGAEVGFAMLFGPIFGSTVSASYVVWRFIEYVLPILAAVPLLGLRSRGGSNVYQRLARIKHAFDRFLTGLPGMRRRKVSGGIRFTPKKADKPQKADSSEKDDRK
jgi:uncharacterized protein (TIRG00374 family)